MKINPYYVMVKVRVVGCRMDESSSSVGEDIKNFETIVEQGPKKMNSGSTQPPSREPQWSIIELNEVLFLKLLSTMDEIVY